MWSRFTMANKQLDGAPPIRTNQATDSPGGLIDCSAKGFQQLRDRLVGHTLARLVGHIDTLI
jgi:hypothetical protein